MTGTFGSSAVSSETRSASRALEVSSQCCSLLQAARSQKRKATIPDCVLEIERSWERLVLTGKFLSSGLKMAPSLLNRTHSVRTVCRRATMSTHTSMPYFFSFH